MAKPEHSRHSAETSNGTGGRDVLSACILFTVYFLGSELGHFISSPNEFATCWPPSGIYIAAMLIAVPRQRPLFIVAGISANLFSDVFFHGRAILTSLGFCFANSSEAVVGALILRRLSSSPFLLDTLKNVLLFFAAAALAAAIGATIGIAAIQANSGGSHWMAWRTWWLSDIVCMMVFAPPILCVFLAGAYRPATSRARIRLELVILLFSEVIVGFYIWGMQSQPLNWLMYPFLLWAALRFETRGVALAITAIAIIANGATAKNQGPFAAALPVNVQVQVVQLYMAVSSLSFLVLGAVVREWRLAAEHWKESEERFRAFMDHAPFAAWILNELQFEEYASPGCDRIRGQKTGSSGDHSATQLFSPSAEARQKDRGRQVLANNLPIEAEEAFVRSNGTSGMAFVVLFPIRQPNGRTFIGGVAIDITELRRSERSLAEKSQILDAILNSMGEAVAVCGKDGNGLLMCNRAFQKLFGQRLDSLPVEYWSQEWNAYLPGEDQPCPLDQFPMVRALRGEATDDVELELRSQGMLASISGRSLTGSAGIQGGLIVIRDTTERHQLQMQLQQAQKLEAIGSLAGGIAHDFNNILCVIINLCELTLDEVGGDHRVTVPLRAILEAGERGASLTSQLLAFARKQVFATKPIVVGDAVRRAIKLFGRLLGEHIRIVEDLSENVPAIMADEGKLQQVMTNLAVNARDAMPNGGELRISVKSLDMTGDGKNRWGLAPGRYVCLTVSDTGVGMDQATKSRLFEPFFTTKPAGHGTGLGLSTVHGIVNQLNGLICFESEPDRGTTFFIFFPATDVKLMPAHEKLADVPKINGAESILVVDDDEAVRELIFKLLQREGYEVVLAENAEAAISACRQRTSPFNLIISDVIMPGLNGRQMVEAIQATSPDIRCIFISGYTDDVVLRQGISKDGVHLLNKPFTRVELVSKIREALDGEIREGRRI